MKSGVDCIGVGCGAIVLNNKGEILLVQRSQNSRTEPGMWSRPGGEVEFEEPIESAVERETFEETGVKIKVERPIEITQIISNGKHWIVHGYLAKYISGEPTNMEPTKHDDVKWFPLDNLPENITEYTRNSLNKINHNFKNPNYL